MPTMPCPPPSAARPSPALRTVTSTVPGDEASSTRAFEPGASYQAQARSLALLLHLKVPA